MKKISGLDAIHDVMQDGNLYTLWDIEKLIASRHNKFLQQTTVSATIRRFRKTKQRNKYKLVQKPEECVILHERKNAAGYFYQLIKEKN